MSDKPTCGRCGSEDLVLGVVGDGDVVRGDLEALGFGEVLDRTP